MFLEQGVPQGDVVSLYVFILAVEFLLIRINNTKLTEGVTLPSDKTGNTPIDYILCVCESFKQIQ